MIRKLEPQDINFAVENVENLHWHVTTGGEVAQKADYKTT